MNSDLRDRLGRARLMLLFTPELCGGRPPLEVLALALPHVDVVQVRVKDDAAELLRWSEAVLELVGERAPVLVNDRVDVCAAVLDRGVAGVHVGHRDTEVGDVRALLGAEPLVGLSTHSAADVARAEGLAVDYLGFGPIHPTKTKGYARGLGPEAAWVASTGAAVPVFPIGGIDATNAGELAAVGRACVSSAILGAEDPGAAADAIRSLLAP